MNLYSTSSITIYKYNKKQNKEVGMQYYACTGIVYGSNATENINA